MDLVILDLGMPGMGGRECLERLRAVTPDLKVIVASGYSDSALDQDSDATRINGFLTKPYRLVDLLGRARQVLDGLEPAD